MGLLRRLMGRSEDQTPSERPDQGLLELLAEGGLAAYQRQLAFAGIADDLPWLLDQDAATLRLGEDLALPAQLVGSVAYDAGTWLWAWANPSVEPRMLGVAERARSLGESRRIPSLTEAEVPLDTIVDGHLVALAVAGALDSDAYYRCPYAGGEA